MAAGGDISSCSHHKCLYGIVAALEASIGEHAESEEKVANDVGAA